MTITIHETIILSVVLYLCETRIFTLGEERRPRVIENVFVNNVFGPKRDEITEGWRKSHNEEFRDFYSSLNINWVIKSKSVRWVGNVARTGRNAFRVLLWEPEGRRHLED
jgi:hypothetical protein